MNKVLLILFSVLLLLPVRLVSQEGEFRVITKKLDTFYGKQRYDGKRKVFITNSNGKTKYFKSNKILSIRKEIKEWKYFEWEQNGLTDYLEVKVDSMNREELFLKAKEWIKISFLPTEYDFLIQPDSIYGEYEGRSLFKSSEKYSRGLVTVDDKFGGILPKLEHKFSIDENSFKITLVGWNGTALTSIKPFLNVFYTIDLTFYEGGYKIDPINFIITHLARNYEVDDSPLIDLGIKNPIDEIVDSTLDEIFGLNDKSYVVKIPISNISSYKDESGKLKQNVRCLLTRVEVLFNDLNRTLFNYIKGNPLDPNIYVYYPEVGCWRYYRTW